MQTTKNKKNMNGISKELPIALITEQRKYFTADIGNWTLTANFLTTPNASSKASNVLGLVFLAFNEANRNHTARARINILH